MKNVIPFSKNLEKEKKKESAVEEGKPKLPKEEDEEERQSYESVTFITPDANCMMPTSGEASISLTASRKQSVGTRVSESI